MSELERNLVALGRGLEFPATPPLDQRVRAQLETAAGDDRRAARSASRARPTGRRALALGLAAVLAVGTTAVAASPGARDAVLNFLGFEGATVERTDLPAPDPVLRSLELGQPTTLADAAGSLAFAPLVPRALGEPDAVFVRDAVAGGELSLVYRPSRKLPRTMTTGVGLLISQFRGDLLSEYLTKILPAATRLERLRIGGERAAWIAGAPHFFFYGTGPGTIANHDLEVAENVLLLERGRVLIRIEGALGRDAARSLARSLAPR